MTNKTLCSLAEDSIKLKEAFVVFEKKAKRTLRILTGCVITSVICIIIQIVVLLKVTT